jgi:hypothetical protein
METYYAYLRWCQDYNERNLIDPTSEKMEWHHTLPQCIFGDIRIGLWLTLKQHAIATALQTLAFNYNCLCGWHISLLPSELYTVVKPYYSERRREVAYETLKRSVGIHAQSDEERAEVRRKGGLVQGRLSHVNRTALFAEGIVTFETRSRGGKRGGRVGGLKGGKRGAQVVNSTKWIDPNHPELGAHHFNTLKKLQRQHGYPDSRENRIKSDG